MIKALFLKEKRDILKKSRVMEIILASKRALERNEFVSMYVL